ncbi:MAG: 23S rRNA (adenine(2503)-C(2))-methyltransferase RlmN [Mycobacteriales bacterium]
MTTSLPLVFDAPRRGKPPRHLADLSPDERRAAAVKLGEPAYRGDQLARWYYGGRDTDPAAMTDVPARSRARLVERLLPQLLTPVKHLACDDRATRKTLWRCHDGALVESVVMRYPDRTTVCVSSQAGCGMGCPFCATGQAGLTRNLSTAEIVEQVVAANRALRTGEITGPDGVADRVSNDGAARGLGSPRSRGGRGWGPDRVSNIVFMGMGEPLANYDAVLGAVRRFTEPSGVAISQRSVTVSTVGLVPAMRRLGAERLNVTLAVSLHAPDDELRDTLVPVNTRWRVAEVLGAAWDYAALTNRRVSIEYALIRDINDQAWRAELLGSLLRGHLVHVNLIPLNPTPGSKWTASRRRDQDVFVARLEAAGVPTTVRDTRGREVAAACGQLRAEA